MLYLFNQYCRFIALYGQFLVFYQLLLQVIELNFALFLHEIVENLQKSTIKRPLVDPYFDLWR